MTSNLPFSEWNQIFQGERMTAALLDRLTHHCQIFEMNGESYRFRESMKSKRAERRSETELPPLPRTAILKNEVGQNSALGVGRVLGAHFHSSGLSWQRLRAGTQRCVAQADLSASTWKLLVLETMNQRG